MINRVFSQTPFITVTDSTAPPDGVFSITNHNHSGLVNYNYTTHNLEVYNGQYWQPLSTDVNIDLHPDMTEVIEWCKKKMAEEIELKKLMDQHPSLRDAWDKFQELRILLKK